jgi:hypothetical protein
MATKSQPKNTGTFGEAPPREKRSTDKDIVRSLTPIQQTEIKMGTLTLTEP